MWDCIEHEMAGKAENKSCRGMTWHEARYGGAHNGVSAEDHVLFSLKSRQSNYF